MRSFMFRNAKGALFFAAVTVLGVVGLIGSEDNEGALLKAASEIERQRAMADGDKEQEQEPPPTHGFAQEDQAPLEFSTDEELIDSAQGLDPTPDIEPPLVSAEPDVVLVESSAEIIYN